MRLLIVEDDALMTEMLRGIMEPVCSLIDSTDNLRDAMISITQNRYNIILLDLNLRGSGKAEAFAMIPMMKDYGCVVLVVSGIPETGLKDEAIMAGADAFLAKGADLGSNRLLFAANVAVLRALTTTPRSATYDDHVRLLHQMTHAA